MAGDRKRRFVREYLQRELPDYVVSEKCDSDPGTLAFLISTSSHSALVKIQRCLVEHESSRQLGTILDSVNISDLFRQHPDIDACVISCAPDRFS